MGLYDRDYTQHDFGSRHGYAPQMRMAMPSLTPVVKSLLIANVAVFLLCVLIPPVGSFLLYWCSVFPETIGMSLQPWRVITYQFLHDTHGFGHILWNMVGLYFFGIILEQRWGSRKFLSFYLVCGAMGGIFYPILAHAGWLEKGPLIGASGAILGIIAACAVMFPNMRVLLFFMFPMRLIVLAAIIAGISIVTLLRPDRLGNAGGEAAHLAGMVAGAVYVLSASWRARAREKIHVTAARRRTQRQRNLQAELDRILEKVHSNGIHSLTRAEKKILKEATEAERRRGGL